MGDRWLTRKTRRNRRIFRVRVEEVEGSQNDTQNAAQMPCFECWHGREREGSHRRCRTRPQGRVRHVRCKGWGEEGVEHDNHALGVFDVFDVMGKRPNTTNTPWGRVCCVRREGWVRRGDVEAKG